MNVDDALMRTTINVRSDWFIKICDYAEKSGMSSSEIIILLLEKQIARMSKDIRCTDRTMRYQQRGCAYSTTHISLSCFQYSRFRDVMLCFRFCLSFILGLAMESFDEIMSHCESSDSYPGEAYTKIITSINNMNIYLNMWGIPTETHTLIIPPD